MMNFFAKRLRALKIARAKARRGAQEDGFTLIEMMVVIVIIGLLTTVVVINVLPAQDKAMVEKARADINTLEQALEMYRLDMLEYPTVEQGLTALIQPPNDARRPERYRPGGYIRDLPADPWGNPYQYVIPGERGAVDIYSLGADSRLGGDGLDSDIGNWNDTQG